MDFGDLLTPVHLLVLVVIALLVFGPSRLPELGAAMGRTITAFRHSMAEGARENQESGAHPAALGAGHISVDGTRAHSTESGQ